MPLPAGTRLGPYEIVALIGAGGMGEVYRAKDNKLKRDVALTVLPETLASDPDRMTRFQREAEVLASLNLPSNAPTLTMRATEAGMIMGTAAYMSPEQASGKPVDKRTDIWSFGVLLWEMLIGQCLFDGETISHMLADVLRGNIDFSKLPKD